SDDRRAAPHRARPRADRRPARLPGPRADRSRVLRRPLRRFSGPPRGRLALAPRGAGRAPRLARARRGARRAAPPAPPPDRPRRRARRERRARRGPGRLRDRVRRRLCRERLALLRERPLTEGPPPVHDGYCAIIPTYDNAATLARVVSDVR